MNEESMPDDPKQTSGIERRSVLGMMGLTPSLVATAAASAQSAAAGSPVPRASKPRIAVFSGSTATIQNSAPLITTHPPSRPGYQSLRPQRLAAPVTVYVEQFSAHPLEHDAAELYGPPDGWVLNGVFSRDKPADPSAKSVYAVELKPEDGLFALPYVARQKDGSPWTSAGVGPEASVERSRQIFYPDASRIYEEIDRFGFDNSGIGGMLSSRAEYDFYRAAPSAGYTKGLPAAQRTDFGQGDIPPEVSGRDYFVYAPHHLRNEPASDALARATNIVQAAMSSGRYVGGQWLEGSPTIEETLYWLNLLIDTTAPIVGHSAQRAHGMVSADGDRNIIDGVRYLTSRIWADGGGADRVGVVLAVDELLFSARDVAKTDARPGGYATAGGHGGLVGAGGLTPHLTYVPVRRHTASSMVNLTRLPVHVRGVRRAGSKLSYIPVTVKEAGRLLAEAIPAVSMVKFVRWPRRADDRHDPEVLAALDQHLQASPLAGFVAEGASPTGRMDPATENSLALAVFSGNPVVRCGRGNTGGFADVDDPFVISGSNLTATKARILLMAALLKLGALPLAADPRNPTVAEQTATRQAVKAYQEIFDTH